jgi:hypothetical protein
LDISTKKTSPKNLSGKKNKILERDKILPLEQSSQMLKQIGTELV